MALNDEEKSGFGPDRSQLIEQSAQSQRQARRAQSIAREAAKPVMGPVAARPLRPEDVNAKTGLPKPGLDVERGQVVERGIVAPGVHIIDPRNPTALRPPTRNPSLPAFRSGRPDASAQAPAATSAPDLSGAATAGSTVGDSAPRAGSLNTFTGSNGVTRRIAPAPAASAARPSVARRPAPAAAPEPSAPTPAASFQARGAQGASIGNPAEDRRRLEIALSSTKVKGRPSLRRALMEQFGAQQQREFDGRQAALGATRDLEQQGQRLAAEAQQGEADRRQEATLRSQELQSAERIARRPQVTTAADGTLGLVRDDASFTPVTDPEGQAVRTTAAQGGLTAPDLLKAYSEQRAAIMEGLGTPEEKAAALNALDADPLFAQLRGGGAAGGAGTPPVPGAQRAPDGQWYVQNEDGSYSQVVL